MGEIADRIGIMYGGNIVVIGDAKQVFSNPSHPYTKGLISSFPTIHGPKERLYGIPGDPVNLLQLPDGCNFNPRCDDCMDICKKDEPQLIELGADYKVACHKL